MYKVQKLSEIAKVSVRTLHHYDQIGLLKPSVRTEAGYRLYGEEELLRLQQILFFRELDFSLREIQAILDKPGFDILEALRYHKQMLQQKAQRMTSLLNTIDMTIEKIEKEQTMDNHEELFEGFSKEQAEEYKEEARRRYDPAVVAESEARTSKWSKEKWKDVQKEGGEIYAALAEMMELPVNNPEVQKLIQKHFHHIGNFYTVTPEIYRGLGSLYTEDPRFRAFYDKIKPGLADFLHKAMIYFCDHSLGK